MTKRKTSPATKAGKSKAARANKGGATRSHGDRGKERKTKTALSCATNGSGSIGRIHRPAC